MPQVFLQPNFGFGSLMRDPAVGLSVPNSDLIGEITLKGPVSTRWVRTPQEVPYLAVTSLETGAVQVLVWVALTNDPSRRTYLISAEHPTAEAAWVSLRGVLGIESDPRSLYRNDPKDLQAAAEVFSRVGQVEVGGRAESVDPLLLIHTLFRLKTRPPVSGQRRAMVVNLVDNPHAVVTWPSHGGQIHVVTAMQQGLVVGPTLTSLSQALAQAGATRLVRF